MIKIAAIIPTFNRKEHLRNVLVDLYNQILNNSKIEIIAIVDGSSDGTLEMLKGEYPEVHIIQGTGNWWYTKCINEGIKYAQSLKAYYFLTLNDDIRFDSCYIKNLLEVIYKEGEDCIVGSVSYTLSEPHRITFGGIKKIIKWRMKEINYYRKFTKIKPNMLSGYKPTVNLSGRGVLFPIRLIEKIGYYDEKLVQYGSDTDFTYRAYKAGIKTFVSYDARIFENEKLTGKGMAYNNPLLSEFIKSYFNRYSNNSIKKNIYYYFKHGNVILLPLYIGIMVLAAIRVYFFKYKGL